MGKPPLLFPLFVTLITTVFCFACKKDEVAQNPSTQNTVKEKQNLPLDKAIAYLINNQREDGSWPGSRTQTAAKPTHAGSVAPSALVCMALLEYENQNESEIRPALEKGINACLRNAPNTTEHWSYIWSQTYTLHLCAKLSQHPYWKKQIKDIDIAARDTIQRLCENQNETGGWGG